MLRMVQHVFAEVALAAIGLGLGGIAHDIAILAAGGIFGRAGLHIVGTAIGVVVIDALRRDRGRIMRRRAGGQRKAHDRERDQVCRGF